MLYVALHYVGDPVAFGLGALAKGAGESVAIIGLLRIKSSVFFNCPAKSWDVWSSASWMSNFPVVRMDRPLGSLGRLTGISPISALREKPGTASWARIFR